MRIGQIQSGRAMACTYRADGTLIWVADYQTGDWIGAEHALGARGKDANNSLVEVTALSTLQIGFLSPDQLRRSLESSPDLRADFMAYSLRLSRDMTARFVEARSLSAKGRVCAALHRLSQPIGVESGRAIIRPVPVFSDLAFRAGSTRETVSRVVSALVRKGIIKRRPGALVIIDPEAFRLQIDE